MYVLPGKERTGLTISCVAVRIRETMWTVVMAVLMGFLGGLLGVAVCVYFVGKQAWSGGKFWTFLNVKTFWTFFFLNDACDIFERFWTCFERFQKTFLNVFGKFDVFERFQKPI